jgi:hypothetical protein
MSARLDSRRRFLGAGALLGLPLLDALPRAHADALYPRRFVFVYNPNGTVPEQFWPTGVEEDVTEAALSGLTLPTITSPLEPFKDRLLFLRGLDLKVTEVGPGGPHQRGLGSLLTGRELQEGVFVDGCGRMAGWANGISIDQEIAKHVGQSTLLPSLELGVRAAEADVRGRMSYAGPGNPMPPVNSPLLAYERLFSNFQDVDPLVKEQRADVVDTLYEQYEGLRPVLGVRDRAKVEQHLEIMRGVERRTTLPVDTTGCGAPTRPAELDENDEDSMAEIADLQVNILASAFACDLTRVATLQFSSAINEIRFPWLDGQGSGHALSHSGESDLDSQTALVARSQWYAQRVANLLAALDAIPEGQGTVLDNSVVVWGNELGLGNAHTLTDIPFMVAGSAGGYLRTGRYLRYDGVAHNQLWVAMLNAMGVDATEFGHPDFASGALSSLV